MKRYFIAVAALLSLGVITTAVFADGEWLRTGPVWLKGLVYAGTSKVAITNAAGNLSTTSGTYSGNVAVGGTLAVTGATTLVGNLSAPTGTFSGNLIVAGTVAVTGASTLRSTLAVTDAVTMSDEIIVGDTSGGATADTGSVQGSGVLTVTAIQATTVGSAGDNFTLPVAVTGMVELVCNAAAANAMDLFPNTSAQINKESADTAISLAAGECAWCVAFGATRWGCTIGSAN